MSRQEKWFAGIFGALLLIAILLALNLWMAFRASGSGGMPMMPMMGGGVVSPGASNGERIFKTGTNARGEALSNSMMMGMGGCAMCHGPDGRGGQMMGRTVPCNTFRCLSAAGYSEDLIKRAVTQGVGADGRQLDLMMPRWQLSDADFADLTAYLKSLP